jgi:hypothetical protein
MRMFAGLEITMTKIRVVVNSAQTLQSDNRGEAFGHAAP